jgi:hypothetical protein
MSEGARFTTLEAWNLGLNCMNFDSEKLYYLPLGGGFHRCTSAVYLVITVNLLLTYLLTYLLTHSLTHSMEQSPSWETNRFSVSQEIWPHFMEPQVSLPHSQVSTTCPYPEPVRSIPYPTSHFLKTHLNIILPSWPGSPKWPLSLRFPHQKPVHASPLPHTRYMPAHLILDFITRTILGEQYRSLSSLLCSFLHWSGDLIIIIINK